MGNKRVWLTVFSAELVEEYLKCKAIQKCVREEADFCQYTRDEIFYFKEI